MQNIIGSWQDALVIASSDFPVHWRWCRFGELSVRELQFIYMARQQVFCVEQHCAYLDADGRDESAYHLAAWTPGQSMPMAYARVIDPGAKYAEPSIGRVVTVGGGRGIGLGRALVERAITQTAEAFAGLGIRISAQSHLQAFYQSVGFEPVGEIYLEDAIPHLEMFRPA